MPDGIIIIHGLTGTPATMAPLTASLAARGFKVITPLLAGHGTNAAELAKTNWESWYKSAEQAYDSIRPSCNKIYCVGLSLGALLAIKLALDKEVTKIACLGTPLHLAPFTEKVSLPLSHIPLVERFIKYSKKDWTLSVADEEGREIMKNSSYDRVPIRSVWELKKLQGIILKGLSELTTPTLIIHSRYDRVAPASNVDSFIKHAVKITPQVLWLSMSAHVVTLDHEQDMVADAIIKFLTNSQTHPF